MNSPYVLAHELGHHVAMKYFNDDTEERADKEGRILIESFMGDYLKVYFGEV